VPADLPAGWLGAMVFVLALALFAWAIVTITRTGSNVPTNRPATTIVESGPYRLTRNPIYFGMFLGLLGLALAFDNLWLLVMLVPFALVIRYGVVSREEAYLERKFGDVYRGYRARGAGCSVELKRSVRYYNGDRAARSNEHGTSMRISPIAAAALAMALGALTLSPALAWGDEGHEVVHWWRKPFLTPT